MMPNPIFLQDSLVFLTDRFVFEPKAHDESLRCQLQDR